MVGFTAEELIGEAVDAEFVALALPDHDGSEEDEAMDDDDPLAAFTTDDKAAAIRSVIFMLTEHPNVEEKVLSGLKTMQERLRKQKRKEQEAACMVADVDRKSTRLNSSH